MLKSPFPRTLLAFSVLVMTTLPNPRSIRADEIGFIEKYALADDRQAMLETLVPGSEEYYFYHCLHHQVRGDLTTAETFLEQWEQAILGETSLRSNIRDRQRLLTYTTSPDRTIDHLKNRLEIRHDHLAPAQAGQRQWPDSLDPSLLVPARVIQSAFDAGQTLSNYGLTILADSILDAGPTAPVASDQQARLGQLLRQMEGVYYPRLGELVIAELRGRNSNNLQFGDLPAHQNLTLAELRAVAAAFPGFRASRPWSDQVLLRLRPDADSDPNQQPEVMLEYLRRIDAFAQTLPDAQNGLKAAARYRLLEALANRGEFPQALFIEYLKLPRQSPLVYVDRRFGGNNPLGSRVNLVEDFRSVAPLPPIDDEQPLVRRYLERLLRDAPSTADFDTLVETNYLKQVFAETKLLYGIGQPNRWYEALNNNQRQTLNERVELTLAEENPTQSNPDSDAKLLVDIKNVNELTVRVYEINCESYYRTRTETINTDIDLDGLVPTAQQRFEYALPPIRRHREQIDLPTVSGRGIWVVDVLGGGLRSRAILRRGELRYLEQPTASGRQFTILNEARQPVPTARMLIAGRQWLADDQGRIAIPPVDSALTRNAILLDEQIATPVMFIQPGEAYQLKAAMAVNRQQIQAGREADLFIRPRLNLNDLPIDPSMLEDATVTITATDQDGIATTQRYDGFTFDQASETTVRFRVPSRIAQVQATVSGRILTLASNRKIELTDSQTWRSNEIDNTSETRDIHLTRDGENWLAEVRGLNGEPIAGYSVNASLLTVYASNLVEATLETDENGRVQLGPLPGVREVTLFGPGMVFNRSLNLDAATWPDRLHGLADGRLELPVITPGLEIGRDYRLLSVRGDKPVEDLSSASLKLSGGLLVIENLAAGDYLLLHRHAADFGSMPISITAGPEVNDVAAGSIRNLGLAWPTPVAIDTLQSSDDEIVIKLTGSSDLTRVHVIGGRYLDPDDTRNSLLGLPAIAPEYRGVDIAENGYVSDLRLGEEYLYVLRRQYANKYPGVMLPQPSLLVAPWVTDETNNSSQTAADGEAPPPASMSAQPQRRAGNIDAAPLDSQQNSRLPNYNFLATAGVTLDNLRPDASGTIRIKRTAIAGASLLQVIVVDPLVSIQRTIGLGLPKIQIRDLRLAESLNPDKPYMFERGVIIAGPDRPLKMASIGTARIQTYTEIAELFQLYQTISGDPRLTEFLELGRWHTLQDVAKRELYGRLACHEMHVFLKMKDREFFDRVVRPYLENKKEKKLVDHWLLDRDLTPWTELWQYEKLNAFEKSLLGRAIPSLRDAVRRDFEERIKLDDVSPVVLENLIDIGLAGKAMSAGQAGAGLFFGEVDSNAFADEGFQRESLSEGKGMGGAMGGMGGGMGRYGAPAAPSDELSKAVPRSGDAPGRVSKRAMMLGRGNTAAGYFFQQLDSTKQWADNHWDQVRVVDTNDSLIPIDPFWLDWLNNDPAAEAPFASEHLLRPTANRHSALIALALLDFPFESSGVELPADAQTDFAPATPVAVVTKRLRTLESNTDAASLLVGQRFEAVEQISESPFSDGAEIKIAPEEYLTGVAYRGQIVITNPTPQSRLVDCLWQIPAGSLPISGSQATDSQTVRIEPFEVHKIEYQFYFPSVGKFQHYPVCLADVSGVVARGDARSFQVVDTPTTIDQDSWPQIARSGDAGRIVEYLRGANLRQLDWSLVTHRLRERPVYDAVIEVLDSQRVWQPQLWGYAFLYRDQPRMTGYLQQQPQFVAAVGPVLRSPLLAVEPIERGLYEHLEYAPLVIARIHPLRTENEILNGRFLTQYRSLMNVIAFEQQTTGEQDLAMCYYLLLQNRITDAIVRFAKLDREAIELRVQYDYLAAVLALHQGNYERAGELATSYADHPVPRWETRFNELELQLSQRRDLISGSRLVGGSTGASTAGADNGVRPDAADLAVMDRERRQQEGAESTPDVRIRVDGDRLVIDHRNARQATLRFYGIDLELLFSKTPFTRDGLERMATVRPGRSEAIELAAGAANTGGGTTEFRLDENLARQTLLVEIESDGARDTTLYYGGRLKTYLSEGFGQLQVSDRNDGNPVVTAYVKVYSKDQAGKVSFYKDGYTDLRGRFDYATLSSGDLTQVQRFAILVLDAERGATLHEVAPPTR